MENLNELKKQYEKLGEEIKRLENNDFPEWEELGTVSGFYVSSLQGKVAECGHFDTIKEHKIVWATKEQAQAAIAMAQLSQLMKHVNGDWQPDWTNAKEVKWCIYVCGGELVFHFVSDYHWGERHFLTFPTKEITEKFICKYRTLIEQAKPLL